MPTLKQQILDLLALRPGLTDREITNTLRGVSDNQQAINQAARHLGNEGHLARRKRDDGLIANYLTTGTITAPENRPQPHKNHDIDGLSEDEIKRLLVHWLETNGWEAKVAWGNARGIDIEARRGPKRWVIEVRGPGSRQQMRVNYFIGILGETLQRMDDEKAKYSISLPDLPQYRGLWERLPLLAKRRTEVSIIFVSKEGVIEVLYE